MKQLPFHEAADQLGQVLDALDAALEKSPDGGLTEAVDRALVETADIHSLQLAEAVDRRIRFFQYIEDQLARAKANQRYWGDYAKRVAALEERLKARTVETMLAHPELPYQGSEGKLRAQRNGKASLDIDMPMVTKAVTKVVDLGLVESLGIPGEWIDKVTYLTLNTDAVRAYLDGGGELPWARLTTNHHLRVSP